AGGLHVEGRAILALREQLGLEEVAETRIVLDDEEAFFHPSNPSDSSSSRSRRMVSSSWWAMRRHACPALLWISRLCRRECKAKPTLVAALRRSWTMALCPESVGRSSLASSFWPRARMSPPERCRVLEFIIQRRVHPGKRAHASPLGGQKRKRPPGAEGLFERNGAITFSSWPRRR